MVMAHIAVRDGIQYTVCTPHIYPGLYDNSAQNIRATMAMLEERLLRAGLSLRLSYGADVHLAPDLLAGLQGGRIPTLNGARYFLLEPPHHLAPPRLMETCFTLLVAGYVPIITHPERLTWIEDHYALIQELAGRGVWMQVTAGSLVGRFGSQARWGALAGCHRCGGSDRQAPAPGSAGPERRRSRRPAHPARYPRQRLACRRRFAPGLAALRRFPRGAVERFDS